MIRVYETIIEIESENEHDASQKLLEKDLYQIELEQCCVVQEDIVLESETCNNNEQKDIKKMIIENFMLWYTSNDEERIRMKDALQSYLDEDHVDELSLQDRITGMFINQLNK
jgi:hypothetical protein